MLGVRSELVVEGGTTLLVVVEVRATVATTGGNEVEVMVVVRSGALLVMVGAVVEGETMVTTGAAPDLQYERDGIRARGLRTGRWRTAGSARRAGYGRRRARRRRWRSGGSRRRRRSRTSARRGHGIAASSDGRDGELAGLQGGRTLGVAAFGVIVMASHGVVRVERACGRGPRRVAFGADGREGRAR